MEYMVLFKFYCLGSFSMMTFIAYSGSICKINHVALTGPNANCSTVLHSFRHVLPAAGYQVFLYIVR